MIWASWLLPQALKSCPMSNKSPNLVTLRTECLRRIKKRMIPREKFFTEKSQKQKDAFLGPAAWPDVRFIFSFYGYYQQQTIAQKHTKGAKVLARLRQILNKPSKCCQISWNFGQNGEISGHTAWRPRWWKATPPLYFVESELCQNYCKKVAQMFVQH